VVKGKQGSGRIAARRDDHVGREEIVRAALAIIDADGLERLTMRRLADAVGLQAPSLYHHFDGKAAVVADVIDLLWDEASARVPFDPADDPVDSAVAILLSIRQSFLDHPDLALFISAIPRPGERMISSIDNLRGVMAILGMAEDPQAFDILRTYVLGTITYEGGRATSSAYLDRDADVALAWLEANDPDVPGPSRDDRRAYLEIMVSPSSPETVEWGLRRLIEALRRDVPADRT
jgi:AcrR family transcriptional regulator